MLFRSKFVIGQNVTRISIIDCDWTKFEVGVNSYTRPCEILQRSGSNNKSENDFCGLKFIQCLGEKFANYVGYHP